MARMIITKIMREFLPFELLGCFGSGGGMIIGFDGFASLIDESF